MLSCRGIFFLQCGRTIDGYNFSDYSSSSTTTYTYNRSNLPASIIQGGYTRTYTYDTENQRDYSVLTKSNTTLLFTAGKRYYFGDFERDINTVLKFCEDLKEGAEMNHLIFRYICAT